MDVLERLEQKLDKQGEHISGINVTLARQNVTLEEHVRRTAQLEEAFKAHAQADADTFAPLMKSNAMWIGAGKVLALLLGASATIVEILHAIARSR